MHARAVGLIRFAVALWICALGPLATNTIARAQTSSLHEQTIRVRLLQKSSVRISGFGLRFHSGQESAATSILPTKNEFIISKEPDHWTITELKPSRQAQVVRGTDLFINGEMMRVENKMVNSEIKLSWDARRERFDLIAMMDVEEYLKGVLPSEMPPQWPLEALKAQAVAARTYALNRMRSRGGVHFHLDDSINDQVYSLEKYERAPLSIRNKIDRAINETRGTFLADSSGNAGVIYFHSDCGGITENPKYVWGHDHGRAPLVKDQKCALNPLSQWQTQISQEELRERLRPYWNSRALIQIVKVRSLSDSGRNNKLLFSSSDGRTIELSGQEFRRLFGFNRVKSTLFQFRLDSENLSLHGRGHGHGVGMCQKGAYFMAKGGSNFINILQRYYPQSSIKTMVGPQIAKVQNDEAKPL